MPLIFTTLKLDFQPLTEVVFFVIFYLLLS